MSKRILVIDDEEGVRDAFELALADLGYEVLTAASGEAGVASAGTDRPDLVFLDLRMPGISGVETLHRLKAQYPELPVYIVTGFYEEYMQELEEAAADGLRFEVARKPLGRSQIQLVARSILEGPQSQPREQ